MSRELVLGDRFGGKEAMQDGCHQDERIQDVIPEWMSHKGNESGNIHLSLQTINCGNSFAATVSISSHPFSLDPCEESDSHNPPFSQRQQISSQKLSLLQCEQTRVPQSFLIHEVLQIPYFLGVPHLVYEYHSYPGKKRTGKKCSRCSLMSVEQREIIPFLDLLSCFCSPACPWPTQLLSALLISISSLLEP